MRVYPIYDGKWFLSEQKRIISENLALQRHKKG